MSIPDYDGYKYFSIYTLLSSQLSVYKLKFHVGIQTRMFIIETQKKFSVFDEWLLLRYQFMDILDLGISAKDKGP